MKRGDIYLVNLSPTFGHEQSGQRPVLIVSPDAFNVKTRTPIVVPITRGTGGSVYAQALGFAVQIDTENTNGIVRCDQPRALSIEGRDGELVDQISGEILDDILSRVGTLFQ